MDAPQPKISTTLHAHKRQLAWQILVPFLVVLAIAIAAGVLVATGKASSARTWADVSIIWLIAPMMVLALVLVVGLGFLIYGIARLLKVMPRFTGKTQGFFNQVSGRTRMVADGTTKPFFWFQQAGAVLKSIFRS